MYIEINQLPQCIQNVIGQIRYFRKDIEVKTNNTFAIGYSAGSGCQAFTYIVNIKTGKTIDCQVGSWGGANIFNKDNKVDRDFSPKDLPVDVAIIKGSRGGSCSVYATITIHPDTDFPVGCLIEGLSEKEQKAINIIVGIKGGYRQEYFSRNGLGKYGADNPIINSLSEMGLVKINKRGAIQTTTQGRNARKGNCY